MSISLYNNVGHLITSTIITLQHFTTLHQALGRAVEGPMGYGSSNHVSLIQ